MKKRLVSNSYQNRTNWTEEFSINSRHRQWACTLLGFHRLVQPLTRQDRDEVVLKASDLLVHQGSDLPALLDPDLVQSDP